jgi:hypothetical protein
MGKGSADGDLRSLLFGQARQISSQQSAAKIRQTATEDNGSIGSCRPAARFPTCSSAKGKPMAPVMYLARPGLAEAMPGQLGPTAAGTKKATERAHASVQS